MENNYYQEKLENIQELIAHEQYQMALGFIQEELSMPYIPMKYEQNFYALKKEIEAKLKENQNDMFKLSDEQIQQFLYGENVELQICAIDALKDRNIRNFLNMIASFLQDETQDDLIKSMLITILIEQEVNEEIQIHKGGLEIAFNPHYIIMPFLTPFFEQCVDGFEKALFQYPSLIRMCVDILSVECLKMLPMSFDDEESERMIPSIVYYVLRCNQMEDQFSTFFDENIENLYEIQ